MDHVSRCELKHTFNPQVETAANPDATGMKRRTVYGLSMLVTQFHPSILDP